MVKVNVFLIDMSNFAAMNEVYDEFFVWQPKPVREKHSAVYELSRADR